MQWLFNIVIAQMLNAGFINAWARARIWQSVAQNVNGLAWTKVRFDSVSFSNRITVDLVNERLIIKDAGYYLTQGRVTLLNLSDQKRMHSSVRLNGFPADYDVSNVSRPDEAPRNLCATTLFLNVGDFLELWVYHDHGPNRSTHNFEYSTWLDCHRLS